MEDVESEILQPKEACEKWLTEGKHACFLNIKLDHSEDDYFDDDEDIEFLKHEAFAIFRAGMRYAMTGNPFRQGGQRSCPKL